MLVAAGPGHSNERRYNYLTLVPADLVDWTVLQLLLAALRLAAVPEFWVGWLRLNRIKLCSCFHCMLVTMLRLLVVCATSCLTGIVAVFVADRAPLALCWHHSASICSHVSRRSPSGSGCKACPVPLLCFRVQIVQVSSQRQRMVGPLWRFVISWGCNLPVLLDFVQVCRIQGYFRTGHRGCLQPASSSLGLEPALTGGITCCCVRFLCWQAPRPRAYLEDPLVCLLTY